VQDLSGVTLDFKQDATGQVQEAVVYNTRFRARDTEKEIMTETAK
jgi:hypothetical protein